MANQPVPNFTRKPYKQLDGGLATRQDPLQVPASHFVQLDNALYADHDVLEKAQGYTLDGSPFPNENQCFIRMLTNYRVGTSVNSLVVAAFNDDSASGSHGIDTGASTTLTDTTSYGALAAFYIGLDGEPLQSIGVYPGGTNLYPGGGVTSGAAIAAIIQSYTRSLTASNPANQGAYNNFTCTFSGGVYTLTSGSIGAQSRVSVVNYDSSNTTAFPYNFANALKITTDADSYGVAAQCASNVSGTAISGLDATYQVDLKQTMGDGNYNYIGYTAGTSLFTNSSNAVVGTGTAYNLHLKAGDKIGTGAHPSVWYKIASITDATHLTLSSNYGGSTTTSTSYMARVMLNLNAIPTSLVFNNKIIISNGSDKMMEFDNTTTTLIQDANAPLAKHLEKHKNRVFAANMPSSPSGLAWSKTNDETVWNAASIASVFPQDNGQTVAIESFGDSLLCFKDNGIIYRVTGEFDQDVVGAPSSIKKLDCPDNLGIIAGKSIVINDDNNLYFSCETGLYTIDPYWFKITKVSWDVSPTLANLIFKATSSTSKQFAYSTQSQWNTGTHNGTKATSINQLSTYNDRYAITGVAVPGTLVPGFGTNKTIIPPACTIDSSNNIHSAYPVLSSGRTGGLSYSQISPNGVIISERIFDIDLLFTSGLSIAVSSSGQPGIVFAWRDGSDVAKIMYTERVSSGTATFTNGSNGVVGTGTTWLTGSTPLTAGSLIKNSVDNTFSVVSTVNSDTSITLTAVYTGTSSTTGSYVSWSNPVNAETSPVSTFVTCSADIKFNGTDPKILISSSTGTSSGQAYFYSRSGGAWSTVSVLGSTSGGTGSYRSSLYVNGANMSASFTFDDLVIRCWTSSNGGSTWTLLENLSASLRNSSGIMVARDGGGNTITGYCDGAIKKRNHSTTTTSTIDSTANSNFCGYSFYSGNDYAENIAGVSPSQIEKYTFLSTSTVSDTTANLLAVPAYKISRGFDNNGGVFINVSVGTNSGEIILRRISFQGIWTSPKQSDATLSSWGTYSVTGENDNGATVLQQIALGATSTLGSPATITSGTVISTDATKIFYQITVTMTIASLNTPVIGSIVLNYQGAGADSTAQSAFIFNNEMYLTGTENGNSSNNVVMFYDRNHTFYRWTPSVSAFARMNQTLYAGSSTNGNVYKMRSGYSYNGSAYTMTAVTKEDMLGSLELNKEIYKIYVLYRVQNSGAFTFSYRTDNYKSASGSTWTDTVVDQTKGGIAEIHVNNFNVSSLQMKISQATAGANVQIVGMIVMYGYINVR